MKKTVMFDMDRIAKKKREKSHESEVSSVKDRSVYPFYFKCGSFVFSALYLVLLISRFTFQSLAFFWLSFWLDPIWRVEKCENCPQYVFIQTMSFFAVSASKLLWSINSFLLLALPKYTGSQGVR